MSTAADMRFIMEPMLAYAITALVAATLVALGMGFRHRSQIGEVRRKLADSEHARPDRRRWRPKTVGCRIVS